MAKKTQNKNRRPSQRQDFTALLQPISGGEIAGPYLRYDPVYDELVAAREQEDSSLPQGIWKRDLKQADWCQVASLCEDYLSKKSKDLQIAAWLIEAWYYTQGLQGLTNGIMFFDQLCQKYWADLHPHGLNKEETQEARSNIVDWIDTKLTQNLYDLPANQPQKGTAKLFTFGDLFHFESVQTQAPGEPLDLKESLQTMPANHFQRLRDEALSVQKSLQELEQTLTKYLGKNSFSLHHLRSLLTRIQECAQKHYLDRTQKPKPAASTPKVKSTPVKQKETVTPPTVSKQDDCHQYYKQLEEIAQKLEKIHPHSPAPYIIKKAIAVDQKSLHEWLGDIEAQNLEVQLVQKWLGILQSKEQPL